MTKGIKGAHQELTLADIESRCSKNHAGCWLWIGALSSSGYAHAKHKGRATEVHRLALTLATGEEPDDLVAAHGECHTRHCCNPAHLSWKTQTENQRDRVRDGTHGGGERHGRAVLTADQVRYIRSVYTPYCRERGAVPLGRMFGVQPSTVRKAARGANWTHLSAQNVAAALDRGFGSGT